MKKNILISVILIIALCFTGCTYGSHFTIGSVESNTFSSISMKYTKFTGNKNADITVKEGETCDVLVDIVTDEGKIDLLIKSDNDTVEYEGHEIPTSSFTVTLSNPGTYKLKLEAKNHKGSYKINWGKN